MAHFAFLRLLWEDIVQALRRGWLALALCELFFKGLAAVLLGPLTLTLLNVLIARRGTPSIANTYLIEFALSPAGFLTAVLLPALVLTIFSVEQGCASTVALCAYRGERAMLRPAVRTAVRRFPSLLGVALIEVGALLIIAAALLGSLWAVYRLLLGGADINYYLSLRPPRFWVALVVGALLAGAAAAAVAVLYVRWFFVIPVTLFEELSPLRSLRASAELSRGRRSFVAVSALSWLVGRALALLAVVYALAGVNRLVLASVHESVQAAFWVVAALLAVNGGVLGAMSLLDRGGFATFTVMLYVTLRQGDPTPGEQHADWRPPVALRWMVVAVLGAAALVTIVQSYAVTEAFTPRRRVTVTAHRAGAMRAPENTLAALRRAIAEGANWAEVDVQRTADDRVVVIHDRDLRRVAGEPGVVNELTYEQLRAADVGRWFRPEFAGERTATLEEFIEAARGKIGLNIELKYYGRDPRLAERVVEILHANDFVEQATVTSQSATGLAQVRQLDPSIQLGFVVSARLGDVTRMDVDFLSLHHARLSPSLRDAATRRGMEIHVWTLNDRQSMVTAIHRGADNLITDDPALAVETVRWYRGLNDVELVLLRFWDWLAR